MKTSTLLQFPALPAEKATPGGFPPVEEIDRILELPDLVLRNLLITQSYHELSSALARMLGSASNWCTFATWASKQAGQTIRQEDLARVLEHEIETSPAIFRAFGELAEAAPRFGSSLDPLGVFRSAKRTLLAMPVLERASAAVSRGNRKVFEEIAREFSRFLTLFADDETFDASKIAHFSEGLRPGAPPDGQGYLRRAFRHFYEARFETDPRTRAERILLANLEIGFHEQTRLQPEIEGALESALPEREEIRRHLLRAIFPQAGPVHGLRLHLPRVLRHTAALDRALDHLCDELRVLLRRVLTEAMMRIELPGEVIRLGRDLRQRFPASLRSIVDPDLRALLARIDPTSDSLAGSGAEDWADFPERMHFLADMFRCFMAEPRLFSPPFAPHQVTALKAGRRPLGRL
ncbi:MAG TPA: hypothetical protein VLE27_09020 [Thermoanaerobaculia bacterium]|nr:hypothetical protein [Thermoanaerobaculia bacterium]